MFYRYRREVSSQKGGFKSKVIGWKRAANSGRPRCGVSRSVQDPTAKTKGLLQAGKGVLVHRLLHLHTLAQVAPKQSPAEKLGDQENFKIP